MLWSPMIGAAIGTLVALHDHPEVIRHGLVVSVPTDGEVLTGTVLGSLGGVLVAFLFVFGWAAVRYRLKGDDVWEVCFRPNLREIELRCKKDAEIPEAVEALGALAAIECCLKTPSGAVLSSREQGDLFPQDTHEIAWFPKLETLEAGTYEARWYAPRGKPRSQEVARGKTRITLP